MFSIKIIQAKKVRDNLIAVYGAVQNTKDFTTLLKDEEGNTYKADFALVKTLVPDFSKRSLGIYGKHDANQLVGRTLTSV